MMNTVLATAFALNGIHPAIVDVPEVLPGPFIFAGNLPDNLVTSAGEVDLTATGAMVDANWINAYGSGTDPEAILFATHVKLEWEAGEETASIMRQYVQALYLRHKNNSNPEAKIPLHSCCGDIFPEGVVNTNVTVVSRRRTAHYMRLTRPLQVQFKTEEFAVGTQVAVNSVGTVPFVISFLGQSWKPALGLVSNGKCSTTDAANAYRAGLRLQAQAGNTPASRVFMPR